MIRRSIAVAIIAILAATVGCTMCCHPYDYCGPVYQGRYATGCTQNVRAGSAFSGIDESSPAATPTRARPQQAMPMNENEEEGALDQTSMKKQQSSELKALATGVSKKSAKKTKNATAQRWTTKPYSEETLR